jgi:hypothetical protein
MTDTAPAVETPKARRDWLAIVPLVLAVLVETAQQTLDLLTPLAAQVPGARWLPVLLGVCAVIVKVARRFGFLAPLVGALLIFAAPTFAQDVDPTTSTVDAAGTADAVAQAAPDLRWSFKLGRLTFAPSASFAPAVLSLKDWSVSIGPNVGAGIDMTWPSGYGLAGHATLRETADGTRPLASLYGIVPFLQRYGLRPGISYQFGGGAAPWRDSLILGLAGASNFGFAAPDGK